MTRLVYTTLRRRPRVGDRVVIERDEDRYPPTGTWSSYRGRVGTVVVIEAKEIGVVFGAVRRHPTNGSLRGTDTPTWFSPHEVSALAPETVRTRPERAAETSGRSPRVVVPATPPKSPGGATEPAGHAFPTPPVRGDET